VHSKNTLCIFLLVAAMALSACRPGAQVDTTPTLEPQAVFTSAAQTAEARMTEMAAVSPSPMPSTPTRTIAAGTVTATLPLAATTAAATNAPVVSGTDRVEFVADLTVPDGTTFKSGEKFTKTWRLINAGTSTWTTAYALVFSSGEQMGGAASTPLPAQVPAGQTVDVSVQLTAPAQEGKHTGYWMLRNAAGTNFGMGPNADGSFYVQINVSGAAVTGTASPSGTGTPGATSTVASGGDIVTSASLSVDIADVEADCPYTFTFAAQFDLSEATTVTYNLDVETGLTLSLPPATTSALSAGSHEVTYTLELTDSTSGTARLHVTAPDDVVSAPVSFTLTCQ
jgi:Ig-like domain from next to BRCA1 gene